MSFSIVKKMTLVCATLFCSITLSYSQSASFWKDVSSKSRAQFSVQNSVPDHYRSLQLEADLMRSYLNQEVFNQTSANKSAGILSIPMPDGSFSDFRISACSVMSPVLAAKFPNIKTYQGISISDAGTTARIDITPFGFHAMIHTPAGDAFIDPMSNESDQYYMCYNKSDLNATYPFACGTENKDNDEVDFNTNRTVDRRSIGTELRTYRLALACTGEYAKTKGDSVAGAMAGMVTSLNRVDGIYERELDIHMVLVDSDEKLIFLDPNTDPYTNNDGFAMLSQNQSIIDSIIGIANYDVGHVFSTGGGGIAGLGVVCSNAAKAEGVTGLPNPVGDAFDVDYVAHEMGHEFGANHTFNSVTGACGGGNRNTFTAYEPGSGSTIMAYAGICAPNDLQPHSDAYFHTISFDEIVNYTQLSGGSTCPVVSSTGNHAPEITEMTGDYAIPINTPFVLNGAATDSDGDALTYCWEEMDRGGACDWNKPVGSAVSFRSFLPDTNSYRIFPKVSSILLNKNVIGEILPSYARTLNFRLTARDNKLEGGGVTYNTVETQLTVINTLVPFRVTYPDSGGYFQIGENKLITWDVAKTDSFPINCAAVNILLSIDGAHTYTYTLKTATPNDGNAFVTIPDDTLLVTKTARIKVEAADNIFFDISNLNFEIGTRTDTLTGIASPNVINQEIYIFPNPVSSELTIQLKDPASSLEEVSLYNVMGQLQQAIIPKSQRQDQFLLNMHSYATGIYFVKVTTSKGTEVTKVQKN